MNDMEARDTPKLKGKDMKKVIVNIITFVLIFILACGIVSSYSTIENLSKKNSVECPYENYEILQRINKSSYVLNKKVIERESGKSKTWGEIYLNPNQGDEAYYNRVRNSLYKELNYFEGQLENNFKNLEYEVIYNDNKIFKNSQEDLKSLIEKGDLESSKYIQDKYAFYMVIRYDDQGNENIDNVYGADDYSVRNIMSEIHLGDYYNPKYGYENYSDFNDITLKPIKDTTFIYAIPKDLIYYDKISEVVNSCFYNIDLGKLITLLTAIGIGILVIGLLVPYKYGRDIIGVKLIKRIPIEINCVLFMCLAYLCACTGVILLQETLGKDIVNIFKHILELDITLTNGQAYGINILGWMVITYIILIADMLLKHILNKGIFEYIKEKSLSIKIIKVILKVLKKIINKIRRIYEAMITLDLHVKHNKYLIRGLGLNFIAISICCIFWGFGIFIAIIYSVCLFFLFKKRYEKLNKDFKSIVDMAEAMSDGNLDINIEEDMGMFNPLKDRLEKIQSGFKKAVNEEVKSQRMKTELISNVSHDLKTPLTSIITYVDLLKKDDVSEEDRKSYIDTLDKKSQRLKFLIEDLFEVSKATSGNINLNLVKMDIVELIRQVQIELDDKFKRSDLIIRNNFPENKVILNLDSQKTFRIFENLLNNASKYSMAGSRVYVDIKEDENDVEIVIKNMSASEMDFTPEEIVERFQRGDKSRNTEGSGLGLAIAKSFTEAQGGIMNIEVDGDLFKVIVRFIK